MKDEVFEAERAEIAAFAPMALMGEVDHLLVMDIPVLSTDRSMTYQFRAVWDETPEGDVEGVRVYAKEPNFCEIRDALLRCGVQAEQVEALFGRDAAGNHVMETCGAANGGRAVAFANAYLTLVGRMAEEGRIDRLIEKRDRWTELLPIFGVNSCGYRIERSRGCNA